MNSQLSCVCSVFYQLQQIFAHLLDSQLQYYVPERFWKVFKLWGQSVNIREQQDALDFYQAIIDQVDEHLKVRTTRQRAPQGTHHTSTSTSRYAPHVDEHLKVRTAGRRAPQGTHCRSTNKRCER